MTEAIRIAVIGLSEAGALIAGGLHAAGASVIGFDQANPTNPTNRPIRPFPVVASITEAVDGADVVLSINSSAASRKVAAEAAPLLGAGTIYADLNAGPPSLKKSLAALFAEGVFVDVAIMAPVPGLAEKVPLGVAGPAGRRFVELLAPLGMDLEYVSDVPGEATARKLLRSILAKGMAAVLIDCLWAAESMGLQDWAFEEILREFDSSSAETAKSYLSGTARDLKSRQIEMMDVTEMLNDAGYQPTMLDGVALTYSRILHSKKIPFSKLG